MSNNTLNMLSEENFVAKMNAQNTLLQQIATSIPKRTLYKYMSVDDYLEITPVTGQLYWVVNTNGEHGVYINGNCIEGKDVIPHIYGAVWDGTSSTTWTRTDEATTFPDSIPYMSGSSSYSSPFDNLMPWSGMVKEERTGGTMVAIPKFWYKLTQDGNSIKIQIANGNVEGFSVSPAHMDRGDGKGERDVVYVGRYHCASDYKSKTGVNPVTNITRSTARANIHNLGSTIWQLDFATMFTIWMLYIVEMCDWNSQAKIGYGGGNGSNVVQMGYTDSMPYHTGTTLSSRTTYGCSTQYRNIEGLWDNVSDWCDGSYASNELYIILNPANFSDSTNGISVGTPTTSGWVSALSVKEVSGAFPLFISTGSSGSESTYITDWWSYNSSQPCLYIGGSYYHDTGSGLFKLATAPISNTGSSFGCRLMELL